MELTDAAQEEPEDLSTKVVGIFCHSMKAGEDPFTSDYYWQAYQDLYFALKKRGLKVYFLTDNNSYKGDGLFAYGYALTQKTPLEQLQRVSDIKVDIVFDRGGFIGRDVVTLNPGYTLKVGNNKITMYKYFASLQPDSIVCNDKTSVEQAFKVIPGENIVVKEPEGQGGKEVYIGKKQVVFAELPDRYPLLVQEFLDTSGGVPGFVKGVHDVRLSICGGDIIGFYIRQAKAGAYHSNVSRGGTMAFFDVSQLPPELAKAAHAVDAQFEGYPRYYAADFMYTPKGWKLLELNPYLALIPETDGEEARKTSAKLVDYLVRLANETSDIV